MKTFIVLIFAGLLCFACTPAASGQCTDIIKSEYNPDPTTAPKPPDNAQFTLPAETVFKITVSDNVDTGFIKHNDYVAFTIAQNVYVSNGNKRCLLVKEGTKVFGIADFSRPGYPFYIKGKSHLHVFVESITLENGAVIPIQFSEPKTSIPPVEPVIRPCRHNPNLKCVAGRREKPAFAPSIVAAGSGTIISVTKDPETRALAGLTLLQSLGSASGVEKLINPPKAGLNAKQIFDVATTQPVTVWLSLKSAEQKPAGSGEKPKDSQ